MSNLPDLMPLISSRRVQFEPDGNSVRHSSTSIEEEKQFQRFKQSSSTSAMLKDFDDEQMKIDDGSDGAGTILPSLKDIEEKLNLINKFLEDRNYKIINLVNVDIDGNYQALYIKSIDPNGYIVYISLDEDGGIVSDNIISVVKIDKLIIVPDSIKYEIFNYRLNLPGIMVESNKGINMLLYDNDKIVDVSYKYETKLKNNENQISYYPLILLSHIRNNLIDPQQIKEVYNTLISFNVDEINGKINSINNCYNSTRGKLDFFFNTFGNKMNTLINSLIHLQNLQMETNDPGQLNVLNYNITDRINNFNKLIIIKSVLNSLEYKLKSVGNELDHLVSDLNENFFNFDVIVEPK